MIECRKLNNSCDINDDTGKNSRNLCPPCRLKKCIHSGMKESLVKSSTSKPTKIETKTEETTVESLMNIYKTSFPKKLLTFEKRISAEFLLQWNQSTLDCLSNFADFFSEFQTLEKWQKEVILLHNVKAMQFILLSANSRPLETIENLQSLLPLLTYNVIDSRALMSTLLEIQRLKLNGTQIVLSLVLCLFNIPKLQSRKIIDNQNTSKTMEKLLEETFHESWKWNVLSESIRMLQFYTSSIYLKTKEFVLNC